MKRWGIVIFVVLFLIGCAGTKTITMRSGTQIKAEKVQDTGSTYLVKEQGTGQTLSIPKVSVQSIQ